MQARRYPITKSIRQVCTALSLSEARVLARVGLSADFLHREDAAVDAATFFALWPAIEAECPQPDLPVMLGRAAATGPWVPAALAFSCSPNVEIGLSRMALFKPLCAPVRLILERSDGALLVSFETSEPGTAMPANMAAFEIVYFLASARGFTGHRIVPRMVTLPDLAQATPAFREFTGAPAQRGPRAAMELALADAHRPLISEDTEFYRMIERELTGQLRAAEVCDSVAERVRAVLLDVLPSGKASAEAVCARLHLSKRSLQRHLKAEGRTFQGILDETRTDLALTYLRRGDMSAEEISYLLAFRDPNSFYRAFHGWTGMTPAQARMAPAE
ncbi:helix-turn-helix domain-containing protein [Halovulum sp. GXIMD14794]